MPDFLDETRANIQKRLEELKPLVDEFHRLEAADRALAGLNGAPARPASAPSRRRTPTADGGGGEGKGRRGRPKGSGTRALQARELIKARPGITIPELAEAMGIKQNYLYRVLPDMQQRGEVRKSGRGWHLAGAPAEDGDS